MIKNKLLKYLICSFLIILSITHIQQMFTTGIDLDQMSIPIFIVMGIAIFLSNRLLYAVSFLLMGILSILTLPNLTNLGPVIIFFIALLYCSKTWMISAILISVISSFSILFQIGGFDNYINLIEGIFGNLAFLTGLYFAVIRQPSKIDHLSKVTPLSCRQLLILKYLSLDIPRKQIVDKVSEKELWKYDIDNFTLDIINSEIAKIKKILEIDSEFSLGIWYNKKTEIPE